MRKKMSRVRGRKSAKALLLAGGTAAAIATVVAVSGAGPETSTSTVPQSAAPQAANSQQDAATDESLAAAQLWRKPGASAVPAPAVSPRARAAARDDEGGIRIPEQAGVVSDRVRAEEPAGRRAVVPPRAPRASAGRPGRASGRSARPAAPPSTRPRRPGAARARRCWA
uniref:hypothetical protein n=1 Tax=Nonomuraea gerenzanensis TaxID=93944 RepID=UPI00287FE235|nr:hypothetical protein [Nonomuraea gerenzanensis]